MMKSKRNTKKTGKKDGQNTFIKIWNTWTGGDVENIVL